MAFTHEIILDTHLHNPEFTQGKKLTKATVSVARYFAKRAECWSCESIAYIAKKLCLDPKTVNTAIRTLRELGRLVEETRGFGKTYYRKLSLPEAPYQEGMAREDADRYYAYMSKISGEEKFPNSEGKIPELSGKNSLHKRIDQTRSLNENPTSPEPSSVESVELEIPVPVTGKENRIEIPDTLERESDGFDETSNLTQKPDLAKINSSNQPPEGGHIVADKPTPTLSAKDVLDNLQKGRAPAGGQTYTQKRMGTHLPTNYANAFNALTLMERSVPRKDVKNRLTIGYAERASYKKLAEAVGDKGKPNHAGALKALAFALANWKQWNEYCGRPQDKYETPTLKFTLSFDKYGERLVVFCNVKAKQFHEFDPMPWISSASEEPELNLTTKAPNPIGKAPSRNKNKDKTGTADSGAVGGGTYTLGA